MVSFHPDTIYGNRSGFQEVLIITANDKSNLTWKSKFFKSGHVHGVTMLGRQDMLKMPKDPSGFGGEGRFTQVQEMKQANARQTLNGTVAKLQLLILEGNNHMQEPLVLVSGQITIQLE